MKTKSISLALAATLAFSSCSSSRDAGAYAGSMMGGLLGSAIGSVVGGSRGADLGTIVGMAAGAFIGANATPDADQQEVEMRAQERVAAAEARARRAEARARRAEARARRAEQRAEMDARQQRNAPYTEDGYYSSEQQMSSSAPMISDSIFSAQGNGDDRLYDFNGPDYTTSHTTQAPTNRMPQETDVLTDGMRFLPTVEVRQARFIDDSEDGTLQRNERAKIIFEIHNTGTQTLIDLEPIVVETSGNKHLLISPSMHVEQLQPGRALRYTAIIQADRRLKKGVARFNVYVRVQGKAVSRITEFRIRTTK